LRRNRYSVRSSPESREPPRSRSTPRWTASKPASPRRPD
jgi:hypothetical protein